MTREGKLGEVSLRVVQLLAEGLSVRQMGEHLCLADNSVKYHLAQLAHYFEIEPGGAGSHLRRLVWAAIRAGLIQIPA